MTMRRLRLPRIWRDEAGTSAVEFALVFPALIMLTLGSVNMSLLLYAVSTLHFAVEDTARWCSLNSSSCTTNTDVQTHTHYAGPAISPVFTLAAGGCSGKAVTGSATFRFQAGLLNRSVPISATACFP